MAAAGKEDYRSLGLSFQGRGQKPWKAKPAPLTAQRPGTSRRGCGACPLPSQDGRNTVPTHPTQVPSPTDPRVHASSLGSLSACALSGVRPPTATLASPWCDAGDVRSPVTHALSRALPQLRHDARHAVSLRLQEQLTLATGGPSAGAALGWHPRAQHTVGCKEGGSTLQTVCVTLGRLLHLSVLVP